MKKPTCETCMYWYVQDNPNIGNCIRDNPYLTSPVCYAGDHCGQHPEFKDWYYITSGDCKNHIWKASGKHSLFVKCIKCKKMITPGQADYYKIKYVVDDAPDK